jgi:hypothetical protein
LTCRDESPNAELQRRDLAHINSSQRTAMSQATIARSSQRIHERHVSADPDASYDPAYDEQYGEAYVRDKYLGGFGDRIVAPGKARRLVAPSFVPVPWSAVWVDKKKDAIAYVHSDPRRHGFTEYEDCIRPGADFRPQDADAMMHAAVRKWPDGPLRIRGSAEFQRSAALAAVRLGQGHLLADRKLAESVRAEWEKSPEGLAQSAASVNAFMDGLGGGGGGAIASPAHAGATSPTGPSLANFPELSAQSRSALDDFMARKADEMRGTTPDSASNFERDR